MYTGSAVDSQETVLDQNDPECYDEGVSSCVGYWGLWSTVPE